MTLSLFTEKWQALHLEGGVLPHEYTYYHRCYTRLAEAAEGADGPLLFALLLHVEEEAHLGLTRCYREAQLSARNWVGACLAQAGVCDAAACRQVRQVVAEAVAQAPESGLVRLLARCLTQADAVGLVRVVCWLQERVGLLRYITPPASVRSGWYARLFAPLTEQECLAMVRFDFSFCFGDREQEWLIGRLARCFERMGSPELARKLEAVRGEVVNTYRVTEVRQGVMTLVPQGYPDTRLQVPAIGVVPPDYRQKCLLCQLVSMDDGEHWHIVNPYAWKEESFLRQFDREEWLDEVDTAEHELTANPALCGPHLDGIDKYEEVYGECFLR